MKISIITAVYNNRPFILSCIQSVATQIYPHIEHIIIDGGSNDGTLKAIKGVMSPASHITDYGSRVTKIISEPDNGIYDALNKGIKIATGDVIGFLHADDVYADKTVIEKVMEVMSKDGCESCYGDLLYVKEKGKETIQNSKLKTQNFQLVRYWKSGEFNPDKFKWGWMPPHPTFFVRREVYEKLGVFDTSFKIAADYELMLRFLGRNRISTCYIPEVLVKMRIGGASNRSIGNILRKSYEDYRAMKMHHIGGVFTLLQKNLSKIPQFFQKQ